MSKPATVTPPTEAKKKPFIRFVPKLRQYESGIEYLRADGFRDKITLEGYTPKTMEDQTRILRLIEKDPYCGITTWENREMPPEQKTAESKLRVSLAKQEAMETEMEAMRRELDQLKKAQKAGG